MFVGCGGVFVRVVAVFVGRFGVLLRLFVLAEKLETAKTNQPWRSLLASPMNQPIRRSARKLMGPEPRCEAAIGAEERTPHQGVTQSVTAISKSACSGTLAGSMKT
jgi:hypothetical protein